MTGAWLTVVDAASRVDRSTKTIKRWIEDGLTCKLGFVRVDELLEFERRMRDRRGRPRTVDPGAAVLAEVAEERRRQNEKWGEQNHPDGTGPDEVVTLSPSRWTITGESAEWCKQRTDRMAEHGRVTWLAILLEEVFEALAEDDPDALRAELIQVSAVAAQWAEAIDRRAEQSGGKSVQRVC